MEADNRSGMIMIGILYLVDSIWCFWHCSDDVADKEKGIRMLISIGMQKESWQKLSHPKCC